MNDKVQALNEAGQHHLNQLSGLNHAGGDDGVNLDDLVVPTDDPVVAELVRLLIADGQLTNAQLDRAGTRCGVTGRTMRNRVTRIVDDLTGGAPLRDETWQITPEVFEVIAAHGGRIAPAYADLINQGTSLPSVTTVWRRWQEHPAAFRGFITKGREGMLPAWAYVQYTAPHRNAVWQGDYVPLPIDVIPAGHQTTEVMPHLLVFQDDNTRVVTAWSVECRPNRGGTADLTVATLAAGFEGTEIDGIRVGGIPDIVRVDNDAAFVCDAVARLSATLGFVAKAVPPHTPFQKGKVEGAGKTVQNECVALMQGYTHGPRTYTGRNPFRDAGPITEATLLAFLDDWFTHYNRTRVHSKLEHGTPLRQWATSPQPIRWADPADLRPFLFPAARDHKVHKHGLTWAGANWTGPGITTVIGRKVHFRYPMRRHVDRIEVFHNDTWKLTAWRADSLTSDQRSEIYRERSLIYADAVDLVEGATMRRNDATAEAAEVGGLISLAAAPAGDTYGANLDDLWGIIGDDDEPTTTTSTAATAATTGTGGTGGGKESSESANKHDDNDGDDDDGDGDEGDDDDEDEDEDQEDEHEHADEQVEEERDETDKRADSITTGATKRPKRRRSRRQITSRRRPERPDSSPDDDDELWGLFDDDDTVDEDGGEQ